MKLLSQKMFPRQKYSICPRRKYPVNSVLEMLTFKLVESIFQVNFNTIDNTEHFTDLDKLNLVIIVF